MTYAYVLSEAHQPNQCGEWYEKVKVERLDIPDGSAEILREYERGLREWGLRELTAGKYEDAKYVAFLVKLHRGKWGNEFVPFNEAHSCEDIFWFGGRQLVEAPHADAAARSLTLRLDKQTKASYLGAPTGEPSLVVATADGKVTFEPPDPAHLTHEDLGIAHRLLVAVQAFHDACWRGCANNRINAAWSDRASD